MPQLAHSLWHKVKAWREIGYSAMQSAGKLACVTLHAQTASPGGGGGGGGQCQERNEIKRAKGGCACVSRPKGARCCREQWRSCRLVV